jgi:hypothetical protein
MGCMAVWGLLAPGLLLWLFWPDVFRDPWTTIFWTVPVAFFELLGFFLLWRKALRKTFVLLEPGRLVVSSVLFGQESLKEYDLTDESRAELAVVSTDDDQKPVYAVAVQTAKGAARFGEILSGEEKRWLVRRINLHLGRASPEASQGTEKGPESP